MNIFITKKKCIKTVVLLSFSVLSMAVTGCSTVFSKSTYPVEINSNPQGASFKVVDKSGAVVSQGKTPKTVYLDSGSGFFQSARYNVNYEGGESERITSSYSASHVFNFVLILPWFWGGIIIDPITGAMWNIDQKSVSANISTLDTPMTIEMKKAFIPVRRLMLKVIKGEYYRSDQKTIDKYRVQYIQKYNIFASKYPTTQSAERFLREQAMEWNNKH